MGKEKTLWHRISQKNCVEMGNFMEQKAVLQQGEAVGTQIPSAKFLD